MPNPPPRPGSRGRTKEERAIRLNRFLSVAGISSRRKADEYILAGRVSVNGRVVTDLGTKVRPGTDSVFFNEKQVVALDPGVYIVLNKPKDCITTLSDEKGRRSVLDVVKYPRRIFPVGRLDRNTTGALILTNDGDFANLMMHPRNKVPKSYLVTTDTPVSPAHLRDLAAGIPLEDGRTAPADVELIPGSKNRVVGITIREGRNRQIHRMFRAAGYTVEKLDRVAYGPISCSGLARGDWRQLLPGEVRALMHMAGAPPAAPGKRQEAGLKRPPQARKVAPKSLNTTSGKRMRRGKGVGATLKKSRHVPGTRRRPTGRGKGSAGSRGI